MEKSKKLSKFRLSGVDLHCLRHTVKDPFQKKILLTAADDALVARTDASNTRQVISKWQGQTPEGNSQQAQKRGQGVACVMGHRRHVTPVTRLTNESGRGSKAQPSTMQANTNCQSAKNKHQKFTCRMFPLRSNPAAGFLADPFRPIVSPTIGVPSRPHSGSGTTSSTSVPPTTQSINTPQSHSRVRRFSGPAVGPSRSVPCPPV